MELVIMLIVLAAGMAIGWLLASQRAAGRGRTGDALRDAIGAEAADALERVQTQLVSLERGRAGSEAGLQQQLRAMAETSQQLRSETSQLVTALRAPQVRGRWGEMQLERVVEAAGMTEHVDYQTQVTAPGAGAGQRPDLVVRLAGGKRIVVDSKVAFNAYLEAMEARDERTHAARMQAHARQLRQHVDMLAAKEYWRRFSPSPEFVVCFVAADAFLDAALREDPELLEHAFTHDVVLATPSTLIALLRTIAYTWRQEALAENAAAIHELGRELYRRISTMGGHVEKLGRSLSASVTAYNDAVGSLERRVVSTARRMSELGVVAPGTPLAAPEPLLDVATRPLGAAEFVEPRLIALHRAERDGA
ncbi:MAG TPA: DNA recombination protein RmuC [Jatrophihabitans sp.]|jgi:DNA recombination protein RmuC